MAQYEIAYFKYDNDEYSHYYYFVYDKERTDRSQHGTCNWTIKVMNEGQYKTLRTAKKKCKELQEKSDAKKN